MSPPAPAAPPADGARASLCVPRRLAALAVVCVWGFAPDEARGMRDSVKVVMSI
jgi:hypothetical protein